MFPRLKIKPPASFDEWLSRPPSASTVEIGDGAPPFLENKNIAKDWDESQHPRVPAGSPDGGQFTDGGGDGALGAPLPKIDAEQSVKHPEFAKYIKSEMKKLPADHVKLVAHVVVETYDTVQDMAGVGSQSAGLFSYGDVGGDEYQVIRLARGVELPSGKTGLFTDPAHVLVHEVGHALDYGAQTKWGLSTKIFKQVKEDVKTLTAQERKNASYYIKDKREMWAEMYALKYSPDSAAFGGLRPARAKKVFAKSLALLDEIMAERTKK